MGFILVSFRSTFRWSFRILHTKNLSTNRYPSSIYHQRIGSSRMLTAISLPSESLPTSDHTGTASQNQLLRGFLLIQDGIQQDPEERRIGYDVQAMKTQAYNHNMNGLENALGRLAHSCPFAIGGHVQLSALDKPAILSLKQVHSTGFTKVGSLFNLNSKDLAKYYQRAPYGDLLNQVTVVDTKVRDAYECTHEQIRISFPRGVKQPHELALVPDIEPGIGSTYSEYERLTANRVTDLKVKSLGANRYSFTSTYDNYYHTKGIWDSSLCKTDAAKCICYAESDCRHIDATVVKIRTQMVPRSDKLDFVAAIRQSIQTSLLASKTEIDLKLYKLAVYSEDGHFAPHVDTPTHDPSRFLGTCIVSLPHAHEGGALIVHHGGKEVTFDFAADSGNGDIVQFAALFGDCQHEVQRVTSGARIVLTYSILRRPAKSKRPPKQVRLNDSVTIKVTSPMLQSARDAVLNNFVVSAQHTVSQSGEALEYFGVFLSHLYTCSGLVPDGLKGPDLALYDAMATKGIPTSLTVVVMKESYVVPDPENDGRGHDRRYKSVVSIPAECLDTRLPIHKGISNLPFFSPVDVEEKVVSSHREDLIYTGNEVETGNVEKIYIKGALIIGPIPRDTVPVDHNQSILEDFDGYVDYDE